MIEAAAKGTVTPPTEDFDRPCYSQYVEFIRSAPSPLQVVMASVIEAAKEQSKSVVKLGDACDACIALCERWSVTWILPETYRCYLAELDLYGFLRYPRQQRAKFTSSRRIWLELPKNILSEIHDVIINTLRQRVERRGSDASQNRFGNPPH